MAFSNAFAQGIEIGRSGRKQKAMTKAFEAMQKLDQPEDVTAAAIPGAPAPAAAIPAPSVGDGAAIAAATPGAIPAAAPAAAPRSSLTRDDYDGFEKIAMEAARASGDMSVYSALNSMMTNKVQTKMLGNLRTAQMAMLNGDLDSAEKALNKAYYYVPDGQSLKTKRGADGQLVWNSPITGKEEALTPDSIGQIQAALTNPQQFSMMMQQVRKDTADTEHKAGLLANDTDRTKTDAKRAETDEFQAKEVARKNLEAEKLDRAQLQLEREKAASEAAKNAKYGDYLDRGGKAKGGKGAGEIDTGDREKISKNIRDAVRESLQPMESTVTKDQYTGVETVIKKPLPPPKGFEGISERQINQISADAEDIAALNPSMTFGRATEMAKERYLKAQKANRAGTIQRPAQ